MATMRRGMLVAFVLALTAVAAQRSARADIINGSVSLGTSALSGSFEVAFILTDGSGSDPGDGNNTITLGNFLFGGGAAGAVDASLTFGGGSGDLTAGVVLIDSSFYNVLVSAFTPGNVLSFDFAMTTNVDAGDTPPDQFSWALLQVDGDIVGPVHTNDPSGADSLLTVNIDSAHPAFTTFRSDLSPAPIVRVATVPEPSVLSLLAAGFLVTLWLARVRRSRGIAEIHS